MVVGQVSDLARQLANYCIREVSSEEISLDIDSDFEGGDPKDEPVAVPEDKEQKKRRNQEKKQDRGNVLLQYCNDMAH